MSDFHQTGAITTLHNLIRRPLEELEAEVARFARIRPVTLTLPSLFSELEGDALPGIIDVLKDVPYVSEIYIGLDKADRDQFEYAKSFFDRLPQHHRVIWNDGPRMAAIHEKLDAAGLAPTERGKGFNVWYMMG